MKKEMLINVLQPEECRIAIIEDGVLEELYVERSSQESYVGNIYKGRIVNIEPSIQAAFVDFGIGRNGFLHVSDVDPAYYRHLGDRYSESPRGDRRGGGGRNDRGGDRGGDRRGGGRHDRGGDRRGGGGGRGDRRGGGSRGAPVPERTYQRIRDEDDLMPADEIMTPEVFEAEPEPLDAYEAPVAELPPEEPAVPFGMGILDDDEPAVPFGAGILDDEEETPPVERTVAATVVAEPVDQDETPAGEAVEVIEAVAEVEPPKRTRTRRTKAGAPEEKPAEEAKPRRRRASSTRSRKKEEASETAEATPRKDGDEPPPLVMESAERRTDEDDPGVTSPLEEPSFGSQHHHRDERLERFDDDNGDDDGEDDDEDGDGEDGGQRRPRRRRSYSRDGGRPKPPIQEVFKRGQEVLVQVIKEGIGTKGPTLSTYISIAGRYLVLMPGLSRIGVSRKIADDAARARLKEILRDLNPPPGLGFIIRTAGIDRDKRDLQNDLAYLLRLWQVMTRRIRKVKSPCEIYKESDIITRTIRDVFTPDIECIWVDEPESYQQAHEFLQIVMPRYADRIRLYQDKEPLFFKYRIEEEIARIQQKRIDLPLGGSIIIEQTEALVAIDVNSGNFRTAEHNAEETAYHMNMQAAKEIARQLRLRDLGGVIVNDFIDMKDEKHRRNVEKAMRDAVRRDRARTKILRISQFGLIEMTRQRIRPSLKRSVYMECQHCRGTGFVKTTESMSIEVMRMLQLASHREPVARVAVKVSADVAAYLLNRKRYEIVRLEEAGEMQVTISGEFGAPPEKLEVACLDANGNEVRLLPPEVSRGPRPGGGRGPYRPPMSQAHRN